MKRKQAGFAPLQIILILLIIGLIAGVGWFVWQSKNKTNKTLANMTHGAGDAVKTEVNMNQPTSDKISATDEELIEATIQVYCNQQQSSEYKSELTEKNMKDPNLYVKDGDFARISTSCATEGGGFRSFLRKQAPTETDSTWKIIGSTQMETIGCKDLDGTGIPKTVAATCYDENGELRTIK